MKQFGGNVFFLMIARCMAFVHELLARALTS